jgi:photosystem II stability/assembly factor-like uncharacterized protein
VVSRVRLLFIVLLVALPAVVSAGENIWTTNGPPGFLTVLSVAPQSPTLFAGVSLDGHAQAFRSLDSGLNWTLQAETTNATISAFAVDPFRAERVFATTIRSQYLGEGGEVYRSPDGGSTWTQLTSVSARVRSLVAHPTEPETLFAASNWCRCQQAPCFFHLICSLTILRSRDSGATWSFHDTGLRGSSAASVVVDPVDHDRIFAGGDTGIAVSSDRGDHWTASSAGLETCPSILALAFRSTDGTLFAASGQISSNRFQCGGVFRSLDGGRTWSATSLSPHYVTCLAIDPADPETIYAGTARIGFFSPDGGVFRSLDGGQTWEPFGSGLPAGGVSQLVIDPTGRTVHAGTSAGVYDYEIVPGARPPIVPGRSRTTRVLPSRP